MFLNFGASQRGTLHAEDNWTSHYASHRTVLSRPSEQRRETWSGEQ